MCLESLVFSKSHSSISYFEEDALGFNRSVNIVIARDFRCEESR